MAKDIPEYGGDHHHHDSGSPYFEPALEMMNQIIGWMLIYAAAVALVNTAILVLQYLSGRKFRMFFAVTQPRENVSLDRIKLESGRIIAYALLLLVGADVLETLMKPMHDVTMEDLYKMALVSAIRTALAYFLGKEIEEIMHHLAHESHHEVHHEEGKVGATAHIESKKTK